MLLSISVATSVHAQNEAQGEVPKGMELLDVEPFDIIYFNKDSGGGAVRTLPLKIIVNDVDLGRTMPNPVPKGRLIFDLVGLEGTKYEAQWKDIERIDFWEQRLQSEVKQFIDNKKFDEAYPLLSIILRDYPNTPGLSRLQADYLYRNAADLFTQKRYKQTLTVLETLRQFDPSFNTETVLRVIGLCTDKLIEELVQEGELQYAQMLHARLESDYRQTGLSSIDKWTKNFLAMATEKRNAALAARDKEDWRAARRLARESYAIWPRIDGGKALIEQIDAAYPLINVGVLQTATEFDPTRIDNWAARRSGRLLYRSLFEITGAGPEGGEYDFLFGKVEMSDDRKRALFRHRF
ncbi:MAG: hypothetical protein R3C05_13255 [Pirellulaceae bacterium]